MQAIVQDQYGEAGDVLRLEEIERPEIAGEVLVHVHAVGVDKGVSGSHGRPALPRPTRRLRDPSTQG